MIAFLGMYDQPALQAANDRYWSAIRAALGHGPERLTRQGDAFDIWTSPDLVLGQTCGLPYRAHLHGKVQLVGTPNYALPGCPPGHYRSALITRADHPAQQVEDLADGVFAYNESVSQSGWAGPMNHLAGRVRFRAHLYTGAHVLSAAAVAEGRADMAGIDAQTWSILCAHDPVVGNLKVLEYTDPTPGLPYVTALGRDTAPLVAAIRTAMAELSPQDRATLGLQDLRHIPASAYLAVPTPDAPLPEPAPTG